MIDQSRSILYLDKINDQFRFLPRRDNRSISIDVRDKIIDQFRSMVEINELKSPTKGSKQKEKKMSHIRLKKDTYTSFSGKICLNFD